MRRFHSINFSSQSSRRAITIACTVALLVLGYSVAYAQQDQALAGTAGSEEALPIPAEQLDSLVAPIALYPDRLLAQTLAASTYPLEVIQLDQWMVNNKYLEDQALAYGVAQQPWDPSIQSLVEFPDVVQRMTGNIQWTTDLGNAFLAQQSDVMNAIQRMRAKAQGTGNLNTNAQQTVETQMVDGGKQVITIEQPNPDTVYVPSYDPQMVYGAAPPGYPYYPFTYPGYYAGMGLMFGTGIVLGGAWANNWGNCNWSHGDININNKNNFNSNVNRNTNRTVNQGTAGQGNTWQHNPQHRGNAPYANRQTANRYGGTARGGGGTLGAGARASGGAGTQVGGGAGIRSAGTSFDGDSRPSGGGQNIGAANRAGAANISGGAGLSRPGGGVSTMPVNRGGGANSIGNRSVSSGAGFGSSNNAFGGGGFGGNSARTAGNRGGASMGGGGFNRAGGGAGGFQGGGGRGGGGGVHRGGVGGGRR
jgi:Protein of unknown function (DUF3300)